jgi:putative ABC transport system permease protein
MTSSEAGICDDRISTPKVSGSFAKDTIRDWAHNWKRFFSIAVITMLGVAVLTGIYAGCRDMFQGANAFYGAQRLYDIQVVSTLGLTDDDASALKALKGISSVQEERSASAQTKISGTEKTVTVNQIGADGLNEPYLQQGTMPKGSGQVAVTQKFILDSGRAVGDTITLSQSDTNSSQSGILQFPTKLKITAVVLDPQNLVNPDGYQAGTFRNTATSDYSFFIRDDDGSDTSDADSQSTVKAVYTAISLRVSDADGSDAFGDQYTDAVRAVTKRIENSVQNERQTARKQQIIDDANAKLSDAKAETERQFSDAQAQIDDNTNQFNDRLAALGATDDAARAALIAQSQQLQQAQQQLADAQTQLDQRKTQAETQFADQTAQIEKDIPQARWYVNTRSSTGSFSSMKSDITSIESIGKAFPIVFLVVAVLISLTTMTRMVEEERGLIGTYLGLGYGRIAISMRYVLFAALACLVGGGLGDLAGFLGIPALLLVVLKGLYVVPGAKMLFDWTYGTVGIALFVVGVVIATAFACRSEMKQTPARLMQPKSPKAGSRVLLEYVTPIWKRMKFLNKVTVRNLFRFKGRLLMTVGGIAGCTALIVCGLAINDSVNALGPRQYGEIYQYDLLAVSGDDDFSALRQRLRDDGKTSETMEARIENTEMSNAGDESQTVQLVIVPDAEKLNDMVSLQPVDSDSGASSTSGAATARGELKLGDSGIIVAQSAAAPMGVSTGSTVTLRGQDLQQAKAKVSAVDRNLIGSDVYMTTAYYEKLFGPDGKGIDSGSVSDDASALSSGSEVTADSGGSSGAKTSSGVTMNAIYAKLTGTDESQIAYADKLADDPIVLSSTSTVGMERDFSFDLMSAVVALIVGLAGGLALIVLFTLASTNISERVREIATLKVLGFYDREVHAYVNKEMMILTLMGIVVGLPLGRYVGGLLTSVLNMPSLYFEVNVNSLSYVVAAGVTLLFALLVQLFTNPVLDRIDPVSSLKSVE